MADADDAFSLVLPDDEKVEDDLSDISDNADEEEDEEIQQSTASVLYGGVARRHRDAPSTADTGAVPDLGSSGSRPSSRASHASDRPSSRASQRSQKSEARSVGQWELQF
jgi:hypothetical protein